MLLDSPELAAANRRALDIPRDRAAELGRSAVAAAEEGFYLTHSGQEVSIAAAVAAAIAAKCSIAPNDPLPTAAPKSFPSTRIGLDRSAELLRERIHRVLTFARAFGYESLVLGAWGCGAFGNDPHRTAADFKAALDTEFAGAFSTITFAITDWSEERRFLGPFRRCFPSSAYPSAPTLWP